MSVFDESLNVIDNGRLGLNEGLSHGFEKLSEYVPGIQRGNMYLIGGTTGSGKTALAMSAFVNAPYEDWKNTEKRNLFKLKIFVWSMEVSKEILMAKFICRKIFLDKGILLDINYVLSRGKNRVSQEIYDLVRTYRTYFNEFEDIVTIYGSDNPTGIRSSILNYMHQHGKDTYTPIERPEGSPAPTTGKDGKAFATERYDKFVANPGYENMYTIAVIDHLNILKRESRDGRLLNKKENIDRLIEYFIEMENRYKITPVPLQQIGRGVESNDRLYSRNNPEQKADIQLSDFKETGDTTDAAHFVLALNYPQRYEFPEYRKYNLTLLKDRARFISVLKNRDGNADIGVGLGFLGEIGSFSELPHATQMTPADYTALSNIRKYVGRDELFNTQ